MAAEIAQTLRRANPPAQQPETAQERLPACTLTRASAILREKGTAKLDRVARLIVDPVAAVRTEAATLNDDFGPQHRAQHRVARRDWALGVTLIGTEAFG